MAATTFHIATLHRGRYMLYLLLGVCLVTAAVARFPLQEVVKILIVLISLPFLLFLSIKLSKNNSEWTIADKQVHIRFDNKNEVSFAIDEVKYLRNLPRSGGNLLMIFMHKKLTPKRFWRNKLFQKQDDLNSLIHALREEGVEYYYL
ncbi:hypothetical protein [Sphingobacterium sp. MYb382]|uniref:hypothetical protein n=1 Tax=Sphingobacterium sp. MYb382 TaxID=2745278 RepID=UPI0030AD9738